MVPVIVKASVVVDAPALILQLLEFLMQHLIAFVEI
jgi:hypothetical protein